MGATIGDGLVALAIALGIVGACFCFFYLLPSTSVVTDYELCIRHCPQTWRSEFTSLECPEMCNKLILNTTCGVSKR
jgi:hypothetical protein